MRALWLISLAALVGCSEYDLQEDPGNLGDGDGPDIKVEPQNLSWGVRLPNCPADPKTVTVSNVGEGPLEISDIQLVGEGTSAYTITGDTQASLEPGELIDLQVEFLAQSRIDYPADIEVLSNDPDENPKYVGLSGEGGDNQINEDIFDQGSPEAVDVLWVLDYSCSMSSVVSELETRFNDFIQNFVTLGLDYQIGVTTADMDSGPQGRLLGPGGDTSSPLVMSSATMTSAEIVQAFDDVVEPNSNQSATEKVLGAAYASLEDPGHGVDAGLVREDANLAIIVVGDEDDQSGRSDSEYASWMDTYKVDPDDTSISGIIPLAGGGNIWDVDNCGMGLSKIPDAIDGTGGTKQDLCALSESFTDIMDWLSFTAAGLDTKFHLSGVPATGAAGIDVTVDGFDVPEDIFGNSDGWRYLAQDNAVQFTGTAIPGPGAQVVINYPVSGECQN